MRAAKAGAAAVLCLAALLAPAASAGAAAKPAWHLSVTALPSNFAPGAKGSNNAGPQYLLLATNVGAVPTAGPVTITDVLPGGLNATPSLGCTIASQTLTCTRTTPLAPGQSWEVKVILDVSPLVAAPSLTNEARVEGGGAASVTRETPTTISAAVSPFGFLPGFEVPLNEEDGSPAVLAGSHPYQLTTSMGFPTEKTVNSLGAAGHLRDAFVDLPPGELANPAATPVLCTEAELTSEGLPGCPDASQVGVVDITTIAAGAIAKPAQLYNMVPPPGTAASIGFDALGVGVFVHIAGAVRSDGDYGISGGTADALALTNNPVFGAQVQLWGDPSAKSHDQTRGVCLEENFVHPEQEKACPVTQRKTAFLRMPTHCSVQPTTTFGRIDSWEAPGAFAKAGYESADLAGTPTHPEGCNQLEFKPTIEARPTTNLTDSPAGLDFHLRQPQDTKLGGTSIADLKDATVTLPEGLVVNPSSAAAQEACSSAQIGLVTAIGATPIHFTKDQPACPDASRLGTLEVKTPLLAQINAESHEVVRDPEQNPIPRPIPGSVYLAKPFDNPFGSLLALYLVVEDPASGTVAKLAARVSADSNTGRLSSQVSESPQLPIEDVHLHLFEGARAPLRTPPACAGYTTNATLVPWSAPEGLDVARADSFATSAAPGGGSCPSSASAAPHKPGFVAGTVAPLAGAYSPLALRLSREDGSQPIGGFEATMPRGFAAKLAGVPYCSEAQIAQAKARSNPNEGALELAHPSCPEASQIGTLDVGAGAGPTPLHTPGHIYLAGPYKDAPLSAVTITPALAGPFDLGVVVVRAAIYLDPESAQARAVSDPLPTILDGIPLDLRSVALQLDRPRFSLNPTSCDPMSVMGLATSVFGQPAALVSPFQVGGCKSLPYKPKLTTRLFGPIHRGGHPRFRAVFTAKPGEANSKRIVLALPRSEFIDQGHFRTICTRVQFAADQCPAGSVYGHVKAITPLLDYPLEGPVYLRSSSHKLPDAVLALRGPPSQPLEFNVVGRIDSVRGGIRTTIEAAPDAPLSKAIVTLQGGKKGLFQNSTNICKGTHRASLKLVGQNGKAAEARPLMKAECPKQGSKKRSGARRH